MISAYLGCFIDQMLLWGILYNDMWKYLIEFLLVKCTYFYFILLFFYCIMWIYLSVFNQIYCEYISAGFIHQMHARRINGVILCEHNASASSTFRSRLYLLTGTNDNQWSISQQQHHDSRSSFSFLFSNPLCRCSPQC